MKFNSKQVLFYKLLKKNASRAFKNDFFVFLAQKVGRFQKYFFVIIKIAINHKIFITQSSSTPHMKPLGISFPMIVQTPSYVEK